MRIGWVVTGGFDRSGREHVTPILLALVERLARRHEVHVFVLRYEALPVTYALAGATIHDLGRPDGLRRQHAALMHALRGTGRFDVLHAIFALPGGFAAAVAGRRLNMPSVVTLWSGELVSIPDIGYGLQRRIASRAAVWMTVRLATRVTVDTQYMERLAAQHGFRPVRIPFGIDTARFTPADRPDGPPWRLLHVASLNRVKDQPLLLRAMRRLVDRLPRVHLDIVGEDTLGGEAQATASRLHLDEHVTFHGFQPTDRVIEFYRRSHLLVISSRHEAASGVALEAAGCGVPTVGTAVGYLEEWTPERAVAVPVGDDAALASAIEGLLRDPARRERIASAARAWAIEHDVEWTARELEALYDGIARS